MKRKGCILLSVALVLSICLIGCEKTKGLSPKHPVTLTMWHVYGSQSDSPMNEMLEEFNQTVGKEKGILINVTSISNSSDIHGALLAAANQEAGAGALPDLFFCYPETAAAIGAEKLVDWNDYFTAEEKKEYVPDFLQEGTIEEKLLVFPVAKSTEALFVNTTIFDRFAADTGVTYEDLSTWESLYQVCEKYHTWSGGKSFFMHDEPFNLIQLNTTALGGRVFYKNGIDFSDETLKQQWMAFAKAAIAGDICLQDTYGTTCMMTGDIVASVESTASILYFQDTVTYPDNTKEPLLLKVLPCPVTKNGAKLTMQQGVGLCMTKSDPQKEEAADIFAKWITDGKTNLDFVSQTGYMPVKESGFHAIDTYGFEMDSSRSLYRAMNEMWTSYGFYRPPVTEGYYDILERFYENTLSILTDCAAYYQNNNANIDDLVEQSYARLQAAMK